MLYPVSALFRSGCSCKLCERPLQDAYKSCLIFVSRGDGAAWAVSSVIACSGTEGTGISRVLGSVSSGANSVSKSLFPIISFLVFFSSSHISKSIFHSFPQSSRSSCAAKSWVLQGGNGHYTKNSVFHNILDYFKSFSPVTIQFSP